MVRGTAPKPEIQYGKYQTLIKVEIRVPRSRRKIHDTLLHIFRRRDFWGIHPSISFFGHNNEKHNKINITNE